MKIFKSKWKKIVLSICFILVASYLAILFWNMNNTNKTKESLDKINNTKLTLADVMGTNLPPAPNKDLNDFTVSGFDVNNNGIRDDVELAIFEKYPNSAKIRSGMLQYAQALQLELTEVIDTETMILALQKENSAYQCLGNIIGDTSINEDADLLTSLDEKDKELNNYVLNTKIREEKYKSVYEEYMTSYSSSKASCDIDYSTLPN
jgi:hypothetical protein